MLEKNTVKFLFLFLLLVNISHGQIVSTVVTGNGLDGPDGFALDSKGNLYVSNWGMSGAGTTVLKVDAAGKTSVFLSGLKSPDGLIFDTAGNLYISNYASGVINKLTPAGTLTVYAQGFDNPSALAFDKAGNLYVSNHGNAAGTTVSKITPQGAVSIFASGFYGPVGLAFDSKENLYVSNYSSGIINKVSPLGEVSVFASIPNSPASRIQYLAFDKDGNLYVPSYGLNKIYKIKPDGQFSVFAGTGVKGGLDGRADSAQFNGPNSIAITSSGDFYISEFNSGRIRKITMSTTSTGSLNINMPSVPQLYPNYPNPFNPETTIRFVLNKGGYVSLKIFDLLGNEIRTLVDGNKNSGSHSVLFNAEKLSSGVYLCKLTTESACLTEKLCLLK